MIQMNDNGNRRSLSKGSCGGGEKGHAAVSDGSLSYSQNDRVFLLLGSLEDTLNNLHIVNVEGRYGRLFFLGVCEDFL